MDDFMIDGYVTDDDFCWYVLHSNMSLPEQLDLLWLIFCNERKRHFTNNSLMRTSFVRCYREFILSDIDHQVKTKFMRFFPSDIFNLIQRQEKLENEFENPLIAKTLIDLMPSVECSNRLLSKFYGDDMSVDQRLKSTRRLSITATRDYSQLSTQQLKHQLNDAQDNFLDDHPIYCWHIIKSRMPLREKCDLLFIVLSDDRQRDAFGKWNTNCSMISILKAMAFSDIDMQVKNELLNFFPYNTHEMDQAELRYVLRKFSPEVSRRASNISLSSFLGSSSQLKNTTSPSETSSNHSTNTFTTNNTKQTNTLKNWIKNFVKK